MTLQAQTPEERALAVLNTFWFGPGFQPSSTMVAATASTIRDAEAAEREACAAHLDKCAAAANGQALVTADGLRHIAAAIRARSAPKPIDDPNPDLPGSSLAPGSCGMPEIEPTRFRGKEREV